MNENEEPGSKRNKEILSMTNKSRKIEKDNVISEKVELWQEQQDIESMEK